MTKRTVLRFSLKQLLLLTTLLAFAMCYFRPPDVVIEYSIDIPSDLPAAVFVPRMGQEPDKVDGVEWYQTRYRRAWQDYLSSFQCSPKYVDADEQVEDDLFQVNVWSNDRRVRLASQFFFLTKWEIKHDVTPTMPAARHSARSSTSMAGRPCTHRCGFACT